MDKNKVYFEILEDISRRSGGEWDNMSFSDRVMTATIARDMLNDIDKFLAEQYHALKMWASLSIEDIRLSCTEPDLNWYNNDRLDILENIKL